MNSTPQDDFFGEVTVPVDRSGGQPAEPAASSAGALDDFSDETTTPVDHSLEGVDRRNTTSTLAEIDSSSEKTSRPVVYEGQAPPTGAAIVPDVGSSGEPSIEYTWSEPDGLAESITMPRPPSGIEPWRPTSRVVPPEAYVAGRRVPWWVVPVGLGLLGFVVAAWVLRTYVL